MAKDPAPDPHTVALEALVWIMSDQPRAERFLDLTGLSVTELRASAQETSTHRAVLDFLLAHEPDLVAAADHLQVSPAQLAAARPELDR